MKRIVIICAATAAFALSACAADSPPMMSAPLKRTVTPPGGQWEVTEVVAVEPSGAGKAPYLGQRLMLGELSAGDPAGRTCAKPVYMGWEAPAASVAGTAAVKGDEPRPVMEVTCDNEAFGTYVGMADGTLMTKVNTWVLTLKRVTSDMVAKSPAPVPAPAPAPMADMAKPEMAKPEMAKPEAAKTAEAAPDKRTIVYLASYKSEKSAKAGWKILAKKSPILAKQQPVVTPVDLGKKGQWVRLYGLAADDAERAAICKQLGKLVDECGSRLRE